MNPVKIFSTLLLGGVLFCLSACNQDNDDSASPATPNSPADKSISGTVVDTDGFSLQGATIRVTDGASAVAGSDGFYLFGGLYSGTYTLTPSLAGYDFSPASRSVNATTSVSDVNFKGTARGSQGPLQFSFTSLPTKGSSNGKVTGTASGVNPKAVRVVLYIQVESEWWVKPFMTAPLTTVAGDGSWTCDSVFTGGIDNQLSAIAAYLVPVGYSPPLTLGGPLPETELLKHALASVKAAR